MIMNTNRLPQFLMTSDNTYQGRCIMGLFYLTNDNPRLKSRMSKSMCQHPAYQVNVSRKGVLCAPVSGKFFATLQNTRSWMA